MKHLSAAAIALFALVGSVAPGWADTPPGQAEQLALPEEQPDANVTPDRSRLTTLADQINRNTRGNDAQNEESDSSLDSIAEDLGIRLPENPVIIESMGDYGIGIQF